jgi:hypothetical protein
VAALIDLLSAYFILRRIPTLRIQLFLAVLAGLCAAVIEAAFNLWMFREFSDSSSDYRFQGEVFAGMIIHPVIVFGLVILGRLSMLVLKQDYSSKTAAIRRYFERSARSVIAFLIKDMSRILISSGLGIFLLASSYTPASVRWGNPVSASVDPFLLALGFISCGYSWMAYLKWRSKL